MFAIAVAICILTGVSPGTLSTLAILLIVWEAANLLVHIIRASTR